MLSACQHFERQTLIAKQNKLNNPNPGPSTQRPHQIKRNLRKQNLKFLQSLTGFKILNLAPNLQTYIYKDSLVVEIGIGPDSNSLTHIKIVVLESLEMRQNRALFMFRNDLHGDAFKELLAPNGNLLSNRLHSLALDKIAEGLKTLLNLQFDRKPDFSKHHVLKFLSNLYERFFNTVNVLLAYARTDFIEHISIQSQLQIIFEFKLPRIQIAGLKIGLKLSVNGTWDLNIELKQQQFESRLFRNDSLKLLTHVKYLFNKEFSETRMVCKDMYVSLFQGLMKITLDQLTDKRRQSLKKSKKRGVKKQRSLGASSEAKKSIR